MPENETTVKGFFLYLDQFQPIAGLTDAQLGQLLRAMFAWHEGRAVAFDDPMVGLAFGFFRQMFERDRQRREEYIEKQRDNGKKGGRPPKNPTVISETHGNPKNPTVISETHGNPKNPTVISETQKSLKLDLEQEYNQEQENIHPPTPLKGGGVAGAGEKPSRSRETAATIRAAIEERVDSPELREALYDFATMRERMRKPLTVKGVALTLRELNKLASTDAAQVEIVEQSIQNGWQGLFPMRDSTAGTPRASPMPRPQAKPGDFDPDRQAQIMRNVLARHMAREAQEAKQ